MFYSRGSSKDVHSNISNLDKFNNKIKRMMAIRNVPKINNSTLHSINSQKRYNLMDIYLRKLNEKKASNKSFQLNNKYKTENKDMINFISNKDINRSYDEDKSNEMDDSFNYSPFYFYKNRGLNNTAVITRFRLKNSLFGMKDYIYSFFVKAVRKDYKFLSREFTAIFNFLSNVYDISSYLQLYRQFHILTGFLLDNGANIDLNHKININNKELFEQIALKNKNIFYFALKEQYNNNNNNNYNK